MGLNVNILKIVIQDLGTMARTDPMHPAKWTPEHKVREYRTVDEIAHQFDRDHVQWMIDNEQLVTHLGERVYQIIEDVK